MKKIIFSIVGSAMIGLGALQAQQQQQQQQTYDTAGTASKSKHQTPRYGQQPGQQQEDRSTDKAWQQESDRMRADTYENQGMVIIDKSEIPSSMKKKLKADKYAGWENATIYHNTRTGEYVIAPRAYRFDQQGNEISISAYGDQSGNAQSSRQDQRSYDQSSQGQQRSDDQSSQNQQRSYDQSSRDQKVSDDQSAQQPQRSYDQSSNSQQQSDDQSQSQKSSSAEQLENQNDQQQPSTGYRSGQDTQTDPSTQSQYRTEDLTEIQAEQVPATLRRTLSEKQYKGWEDKGTLYQDPSTSEYVLEMETSSSPQIYRFDKNGLLKEDQEAPARGTADSKRKV